MNDQNKDRSRSMWDIIELPSYPKLEKNILSEICVVGAGIAGLSVAYQLAKRGHKVVILEGSSVASGQTGRTTAHLTYKPEDLLVEMLKHHSKEKLVSFIEAHKQAIEEIEVIIFQENIDCDFKRLPGYLFSSGVDGNETLREEEKIGHELGLDVEFLENIPGVNHLGSAVRYPDQAQFNSGKFIKGLLRVMKELDIEIYENSHVKEFSHHRNKHKLTTNEDITVEAKFVVVATDSPVNNRYFIHTKQAAYRSYVVGFALKNKMDLPLMWDTSDPYHYIRVSGDTLILGGEDHRTGQNPEIDPYQQLIKWSQKYLPFVGGVKWTWSGQVFEPIDGMAFIGKNPGMEKNIFIVTGLSGMGMTGGVIASLIIPDLIEGKSNFMTELFEPSRSFIHNTKEFIKENSNTAFQYKEWITPSEVKDQKDIPEDHGSLMRDGLIKNCVYHVEGEEFETKSAVCPHLGAIVKWNDLEKTWDCPCHGSRFNAHGKVIEGPSLSDLAEI